MLDRVTRTPTTSIRIKLLFLLLGISAAAVLVISFIAINSAQTEGAAAQEISSQALLTQAQDYLIQQTQDRARQNDLVLQEVLQSAQNVAAYAASVFDNPDAFGSQTFWQLANHINQGTQGQYANGKEDPTSVFVPNTGSLDPVTQRDIQLSAYLDFSLPAAFENTPYVEAIYFATPRDMVRYYPNIDLGSVLPPDFKATGRIWYTGSTQANDPKHIPWWTPPYLDATGRGLVTTAAMPVYGKNQDLLGVVGFDITLNEMRSNIEAASFLRTGYSFLIDQNGHAIALPQQGFRDMLGHDPNPDEVGIDLSNANTPFKPVLSRMMAGSSGIESLDLTGKQVFIAFAPLESTGWNMGSVVETNEVVQAVSELQTELGDTTRSLILWRVLPVSVAIFTVVIVLGLVLTGSLVRPIQNLAAAAERSGKGDWNVEIPKTSNDEIGILAQAFQTMLDQLHGMVTQLEQRVAERTRDLERRTFQVHIAAEVARDITTRRDLDELLNYAVNLIRERFGFYHAGVFLVDEQNEYAVIRAATGEAGKEMLARGHRLKIGETGIVGYVTGSGRPRIALDVGSDAVHFRNPLLPDTRSEMALPLKAGERVIGALDVQSTEPAAFNEDDITTLQILSDQLAVAIENARLLREVRENLQSLETFTSQYGRQAWQQILKSRPVSGYEYDRMGLSPILADLNPDHPAGQTVQIPLQVRGVEIGSLDVWMEAGELSSSDLDLLKEIGARISQALESARLFEEARARATRELAINDLTTHVSRSLDVDTLLKTAVHELGQFPNVVEVTVHVGQQDSSAPGEAASGADDRRSSKNGSRNGN
jgi:GAF domain-containing protein/HAMP domain-containing protein